MQPCKLSTAELTEARQLYEQGASYRDLGARYGVAHATIRVMLAAVGVTARPVGWPQRGRQSLQPVVAPEPRPVVEIVTDTFTGRLRIPMRTLEERRLRRFTPPELEAIAQALRAGVAQQAPRGRCGLPERASIAQRTAASFAFYVAMQGLKAA